MSDEDLAKKRTPAATPHERKDKAVTDRLKSPSRFVRGASGRPLPEDYSHRWEGDFLMLLRADGSIVAYFSEHGATDEGISREAWRDSKDG